MPIQVGTEIRRLSEEEFYGLHHRLLGIAFAVHNEFGRLLDEVLFQREIAARCEEAGLNPVECEVRIRVWHETFHKDYAVDLLLCHGLPIEAKASETIAPIHRAQALNYLLLLGLQHGALMNFRTARVQHEFVSTRLTPEVCRQFKIVDKGWDGKGERTALLKGLTVALLEDWGAFLEVGLYREALTHLLGGGQVVCSRVPVYSGERLLGRQTVHLLDAETAFSVTAVTGDSEGMREHQQRFLQHTSLGALQWINLNHHLIEFSTLRNDESRMIKAK